MISHVRKLVGLTVVLATLLLAVPASAASVVPPSGIGAYGSGTLGDWTIGSKAISAPSRVQEAVDTGGVWLLGDSLTVATWGDFATRLYGATGQVVAANGWSGRPTTPTIDALAEWKAAHGLPPVVIIASGANDIFGPVGPPALAAQIDRAAAIVGPNTRLIWVETHISRWLQQAHIQVNDQRNTGWINGVIWEATGRHDNLSVVPWERYISTNPERVRAYLSDGVHLDPADGMVVRNTLMVQAVQAAMAAG
ncbi:GDSL-type esterase/lipase family protein [Micromonospora sp. NBC_01740]|uniref:GDSL-type esterase/lipase family protein n=1 Tax=Micromonospora sp. NBC_01740 TaxID=2975986 RepID=UPI002E12148A|nr:GDSL-type esterase/lipase family protein [Micromonospora sp. NBC_01740]